jgi:hypothetical protein
MQTSRNGVESQNRQKGLNIRCVCPGMSREPSTSRIGEGWGIKIKIKITIKIRIMIEAEHNTPGGNARPVPCGPASIPGRSLLREIVSVDLLEIVGRDSGDADVVVDHELSQHLAVNEHNLGVDL